MLFILSLSGNLPPIDIQRKSNIPINAYKIELHSPSVNKNRSFIKSATRHLKSMNFAKAKWIIRKFYSFVCTPMIINAGLHALISLLLFRICYLLLTSGKHRNYCSVVGSTASFGAAAYYAVHPNRIKDFLLQKFVSANMSLFLVLLAVYFFLIQAKHRRLSNLNLIAVDTIGFSVLKVLPLVLGSCLSVASTALVVYSTQSLPLVGGYVSIILLTASLTVSYGDKSLVESENMTTALSWKNFRLLLVILSFCVLYISWVNLADAVVDTRMCRLRPTFGMLLAEVIIFTTKVRFECVKPLWIIRKRSVAGAILPARCRISLSHC